MISKQLFFRRVVLILLALVTLATLLLVDSNAQKKRRSKRRPSAPRITNPAINTPANENSNASGEVENLNSNQSAQPAASPSDNPEDMHKTIRSLSNQVDKLNEKLGQMEQSQRSLVDLERLSRAEQRSTSLRAELRDLQQKQSDLSVRLEDINYALKPENIERSVAPFGSTRPEDLRAQRKHQLEMERDRVSKQLDQLAESETHLNDAIAASDAEVERLRKRLDEADKAEMENAKTKAQSPGQTQAPPPRPSPTPYP
jgi:DNA repair exonuclease SbcCD ATPase subunit